MPRAKRAHPLNTGRPLKHIDWDFVDKLCLAGCNSTEIAPHFDMHPQTFCDRVLLEKGVSFTAFSQEKRAQGDSLLREKQMEVALSGDKALLVWLGKNRLGQRDRFDTDAELKEIVVKIMNFQKEGLTEEGKPNLDSESIDIDNKSLKN